jgi:hypothetical protein
LRPGSYSIAAEVWFFHVGFKHNVSKATEDLKPNPGKVLAQAAAILEQVLPNSAAA